MRCVLLNRASGFGVVNRVDQVVSYALSNFALEDAVEVAVETQAKYRRRGFAKIAAQALLNFSISKGLMHTVDILGWES